MNSKKKSRKGQGRNSLAREGGMGGYRPKGGRPERLVRSLDLTCFTTGIYCGFFRQKGNKSGFDEEESGESMLYESDWRRKGLQASKL